MLPDVNSVLLSVHGATAETAVLEEFIAFWPPAWCGLRASRSQIVHNTHGMCT